MIGLVADLIAANRKILQDTQYHVRKAEYDALYMQQKMEREAVKTYRVMGDQSREEDLKNVSVSL